MLFKQFTLILAVLVILCHAKDCDKAKCPGHQKFYKELNCKPVYKNDDCCAARFECPDFSRSDICYFNGKEYHFQENIPDEETSSRCTPLCRCTNLGEHPGFTCAHYDCAEFFRPRNPECYLTYGLDTCCSNGMTCGDRKNQVAKCYLEGKEYLEGQKMYPESESCYKCVCESGFDNNTIIGNPHCKETHCGFPLHRYSNLVQGCAPIYSEDHKCCPVDFRCPYHKKDEIISKNQKEDGDYCNFGALKLFIGDELKPSETKEKCVCVTPPYLQCIKDNVD